MKSAVLQRKQINAGSNCCLFSVLSAQGVEVARGRGGGGSRVGVRS